MKIDVRMKTDLTGFKALERQSRFAMAVALTRTAQDVKAAEIEEMQRVFDRPTQYTLNSLFVKPATRDRLEARVWLKDAVFKGTPAERYLMPQIEGGPRSIKRFERALQYAGVMPKGMMLVPAKDLPLDAFGNVSTGLIVRVLSQLGVRTTAGYENRLSKDEKRRKRAIGKAGGQFFAVTERVGKLVPGIYQRPAYLTSDGKRRDWNTSGTSVWGKLSPKPIFIFIRRAQYRPRFRFFEVGRAVAEERLSAHYQRALAEALATARP